MLANTADNTATNMAEMRSIGYILYIYYITINITINIPYTNEYDEYVYRYTNK